VINKAINFGFKIMICVTLYQNLVPKPIPNVFLVVELVFKFVENRREAEM
jgi:hypothetical protein